ncbi:chaplin [Kitasatospora sp. CB02891]|uniref:chaplin n=1 Tax=Kitasatospora sp. CB02891 TaxID=2020329 RepID=UPI001E44FF7D|nr:chaplin [Kitasatospora sp. CB02891]
MRNFKKAAVLSVAAAGLVLGSAGLANASAEAEGVAANSPGVLSGNQIQVPVHVPVNVCGNSINIIGLLNPAFGNTCVNADGGAAPAPVAAPVEHEPQQEPPVEHEHPHPHHHHHEPVEDCD